MTSNPRLLFQGQRIHLLLLAVLLVGVGLAVHFTGLQKGQCLGMATQTWFVIALAVPIIHQIYVWFVWRSELYFGLISGRIGPRGFSIYRALFMVLLLARPLSLLLLAISDHDTMAIPTGVRIAAAVVLMIPAVYTYYSVARYFGINRACGIDHFDPSYRDAPMVREGIFRITGNAMYAFGFLVLWAVAVAAASRAALIVTLFSHAYIWVHYFCTERPDMRRIYG